MDAPSILVVGQQENEEAALWAQTRSCFSHLRDHRDEQGKRHPLVDVVLMALLAMICGADDADEIAAWAKAHRDILKPWFELKHGTPSQDTFLRVFALLEPAVLREAFSSFAQMLRTQSSGHIAVDGKTLRGSYDSARGQPAIHLVSAWLNDAGLVLGQLKTEAKSNEITAIPALLKTLRLQGCTVSIDAAGCQREIARVIVEQQAHYVLAVKGNQPTLHEDILRLFAEASDERVRTADELARPIVSMATQTDSGHGRIETRTAYLSSDLSWLSTAESWPGLSAVGLVQSECIDQLTGKSTTDRRTFILSDRTLSASDLLRYVRDHWGIESRLHWVLDVDFREDASRIRMGFAAENMAVLRHAALNLLRHETTYRGSIKLKRKKCGWEPAYLLKVLGVRSGLPSGPA